MNETQTKGSLPINSDSILERTEEDIHGFALIPEIYKVYMERAGQMKDKVDLLAAEIELRQDKMRLINDLICEINNLTDDNNALDISQKIELQEKLRLAKELGANINCDKITFNSIDRDRLIQNLHLTADGWDKENRTQMQKMEIHVKELDRTMIMMKEIQKGEDRAKRGPIAGTKGG